MEATLAAPVLGSTDGPPRLDGSRGPLDVDGAAYTKGMHERRK